ncbi:YuzL family protein [Bacillus sp. FJAT-49736]|nr:YuzL family protein [Bacillus sp. FJAT-49736]MBS4173112.1 YuzL family protein [Bacillus sp. FJAT-49736]
MANRKKDPSKAGLSSPEVKGQGTTNMETGSMKADASRKKHGR